MKDKLHTWKKQKEGKYKHAMQTRNCDTSDDALTDRGLKWSVEWQSIYDKELTP